MTFGHSKNAILLVVVALALGLIYWWWVAPPQQGATTAPSQVTVAEPAAAGEAFARLIAQLPEDPEEAETQLREALGEWALTAPRAARAWIASHPLGETGSEVAAARQAAVAISWAEQEPAAAAVYALAEIPASLSQNHALVAVVQRWAQQDGAKAAEFIFQIPDGPVRTNAATELVAVWADADTQPPAQWIEKLPASPLRDACTDRLARELAAEAPEAARAWAGQIADPTRRAQCLAAITELQVPVE